MNDPQQSFRSLPSTPREEGQRVAGWLNRRRSAQEGREAPDPTTALREDLAADDDVPPPPPQGTLADARRRLAERVQSPPPPSGGRSVGASLARGALGAIRGRQP